MITEKGEWATLCSQQYKMFDYENKCLKSGFKLIAGMDEVGRGPLAGPVCVACVIMPLQADKIISGVNDSKKLTEKKRKTLDALIRATAIDYQIVCIEPEIIDKINILNATKLAMQQCVDKMKIRPEYVLIDHVAKPEFDFEYETIKKGDMLSYSIACASIIAKVYRDNLMQDYNAKYPNYCFDRHKGYGTELHIQKIIFRTTRHGPLQNLWKLWK